jgi:hypothetical protein
MQWLISGDKTNQVMQQSKINIHELINDIKGLIYKKCIVYASPERIRFELKKIIDNHLYPQKPKPMSKYNPLEIYLSNIKHKDLNGVWRLQRAIIKYNRSVDKESRLERAKDLLHWKKDDFIKLLGVGPKTAENTVEYLKGLGGESC